MHLPMWPHAPAHHVSEAGAYIVTAATYRREPLFRGREQLVHDALLQLALELDWRLQAWAVFANHYHFVALSPVSPASLPAFIRRMHASTATVLNRQDRTSSRRVWSNYWETRIKSQRSYLARLAYVHQNAVKHGLATRASNYEWCSATWFESRASGAQVATVYAFPTDRVRVPDMECGA
jgi:putative transposase